MDKLCITNEFLLKVIVIIAFISLCVYLVIPKYTFNSEGSIRKNIFSGKVERFNNDSNGWIDIEKWIDLKIIKKDKVCVPKYTWNNYVIKESK